MRLPGVARHGLGDYLPGWFTLGHLNFKPIRTRKPQTCIICGSSIPVGAAAYRVFGNSAERTLRICLGCRPWSVDAHPFAKETA